MTKHAPKTDETTFTVSGKLKTTAIITILSALLGIGTLSANVAILSQRVDKLENLAFQNIEERGKVITSLARIEENAKFLKENIEDIKKIGGRK